MEAPPYSPTASTSERRLPDNYRAIWRDQETLDPLRSLARGQNGTAEAQPPTSPSSSHHRQPSQTSTCSSTSDSQSLQPISTAPTQTPPTPCHDPFASFELPPEYAPVDELARHFRLEAPFVYSTRTSTTPRYQLMQEFTRSGKPKQLNIRRLMASESRSHSLPTSSLTRPNSRRLSYDEDATMYSATCPDLTGLGYRSYEMKGHRSSTIGGSIKVETGRTLLGAKCIKMWHVTKNVRNDALNPENEARVQKYGYHAKDEWDRKLLFTVKKGVWEDGKGREVGRETGKGEFEVGEWVGKQSWRRDLAVSCWLLKTWMGRGLRWEDDVRGW